MKELGLGLHEKRYCKKEWSGLMRDIGLDPISD
jgi:hypothetical protein